MMATVLLAAAQFGGQGVDERALARAGRAGDADDQAFAFGRSDSRIRRRAVFDLRGETREFAGRVDSHQSFSSWRAITRRWISLVPSPMVQSFTSR